MVKDSSVAVRAVALGSTTVPTKNAPDIPNTNQEFLAAETYWGSVPERFVVQHVGGPVERPDGTSYILRDEADPPYETGSEYVLVLVPRFTAPGQYFAYGGSQGRYQIVGGTLRAVPKFRSEVVERQLDGKSLPDAVRVLKASR